MENRNKEQDKKSDPVAKLEAKLDGMAKDIKRLEAQILRLNSENHTLAFTLARLISVGHGDSYVRTWLEAFRDRQQWGGLETVERDADPTGKQS